MLKDLELKKFGFESNDEMLLYKDVCAGRDLNPPEKLEELLYNLEADIEDKKYTKEEYYEFISKNGLLELLNSVKNMQIFDRMVSIYIYNSNGFSLCKNIEAVYIKKIEDVKEMFLEEKVAEYQKKLNEIRHLKNEYYSAMKYIENEVRKRLSKEEFKFYEATSNISKEVYKTGPNESPKEM